MPDVFTKKQRSQVMAAIRSRGNKATELRLISILRAARITGWRRHQRLPRPPRLCLPARPPRRLRGRLFLAWLPQARPRSWQ
jgi:DNA mismatch endonuclease (patch repair protein)